MRNFQRALFGLSFSVQKATNVITLGTGYSYTEWQCLVPHSLVIVKYYTLSRIIVNCEWSSWFGEVERRAIFCYGGDTYSSIGIFLSSVIYSLPNSVTFCMLSYDCIYIPGILHLKENWRANTHGHPCLWFIATLKFIFCIYWWERRGGVSFISVQKTLSCSWSGSSVRSLLVHWGQLCTIAPLFIFKSFSHGFHDLLTPL